MNISELRIGNLIDVKYESKNEIHHVGGIINADDYMIVSTIYQSSVELHVMHEELNFHESELKPIELSDVWLRRLGFKDREKDHVIPLPNGNGVDLCIETTGDCVLLKYNVCDGVINHDEYDYIYITDVNSIHQLQNLYFSITGKELFLNK